MIPTGCILIPLGAIGACLLASFLLRRRQDREWAAETRRRVDDAEQRKAQIAWLYAKYNAPSAERQP